MDEDSNSSSNDSWVYIGSVSLESGNEENTVPNVKINSEHQEVIMDDEITDDEEPEDYAPDPRDYYSHFFRESERLSTFLDWPQWANVTKEDLAKNGFMYLHVSDRVQCVFCRAYLASWSPGDIVANEHMKFCPECPFAFGYECGNIPIPSASRVRQTTQVKSWNEINRGRTVAAGNFAHASPRSGLTQPTSTINRANAITVPPSHKEIFPSSIDSNHGAAAVITEPKYRDWADERTRVQSYRGWPAQMVQTPLELAAAGLLYMGSGDCCKCFWCGGEMYNWEPNDVPWVEHAKWFPQCGFVRQQKGEDFVINIKTEQNTEPPYIKEFLTSPHVLTALRDYGYNKEQVLEALYTYGVVNLVTADDIRKYVEDLKIRRQAAQVQARRAENASITSHSLPRHLVNRPDSSVAMSVRGQPVMQPSDEAAGFIGHYESNRGIFAIHDDETILQEYERIRDPRTFSCNICMDKEMSVTFMPCRHRVTCEDCAELLDTCPICRASIEIKISNQ